MRKTYFIADVHLHPENFDKEKTAIAFLNMVIREKGDLYILGDLFDFWANNKILKKKHARILNKLKELTSQGLKAGFLIGNRDFLLSQKAWRPFGVDFLGEEAEIILDSKRIFLAHGHTLCLSDIQFLNYKKMAWPIFRVLDKIIPGTMENYIAKKFILQSKSVIEAQDQSRFQFTKAIIEEHFNEGINIIICGHAHSGEKQQLREHIFYVLPAWENKKGYYLLYNKGAFDLYEFKP